MTLYSYLALAALAVVCLGCARAGPTNEPDETLPDDFRLDYHWQAGTMPPPHHYEYDISIDATGRGEITMIPDYPREGVPVWTKQFTVEPADVHELYGLLVANELLTENWRAAEDPPVGGSVRYMHVTAGEHEVAIPAFPASGQKEKAAEMYAAVRNLVPEQQWDELQAQREQYVESYEETE